jgi:hypothetical protein
MARDSAVKARTQTINQLRAVLVRAQPQLRESLAGLGPVALIRRCAELPEDAGADDLDTATSEVLRILARRVQALTVEAKHLQKRITDTVANRARTTRSTRRRPRHRRGAADRPPATTCGMRRRWC